MVKFHLRSNASGTRQIKQVFRWLGKYWFQLVLVFFLWEMCNNRNVQVVLTPGSAAAAAAVDQQFSVIPTATGHQGGGEAQAAPAPALNEDRPYTVVEKWKPADFRNLSFILNPTYAERKGVPLAIVQEKMATCQSYVDRFSEIAVTEMEKYGIPASITLAQGLLETDAGGSRLATESNNHFGIKCRSKCRGCTCRNYSDDDVYDMFRVFESAWESYREHSKLLQISRYAHLKKLGTRDYRGWAVGLKKAGYATDPNYHKKLIRIIEVLKLQRFDG